LTAVEPTTPTNTPTTAPRSRRDVLCGLMVALVAPGALVAACSDSSSGSSGETIPGADETGTGTTSGSSSAGALAALADVPDGGGLIVDNPNGGVILLARTGNDVKAFNAACTHQGTTVDAPENGIAICPNHGSEFSTTDGSVKKGPATTALATINVSVSNNQIVLA
jgi:cytochrome b6-f complex iron-sulfur subunit